MHAAVFGRSVAAVAVGTTQPDCWACIEYHSDGVDDAVAVDAATVVVAAAVAETCPLLLLLQLSVWSVSIYAYPN